MTLEHMAEIRVGDVTIAGITERNGPWRKPEEMFAGVDPEVARQALLEMDPIVYDAASGRMVIAYQCFVVRTPHNTVLVDSCTGEDKGYAAPLDYPRQPWLDRFQALGLDFGSIDYVFCTHMHFDHTGWNTRLVDGRWVPNFPNAKYIFHKDEYAFWEDAYRRGENPQGNLSLPWFMNCLPIVEAGQALLVGDDFQLDDTFALSPSPGHSPHHCCVDIRSKGQHAVVVGDLMHHPLQCHDPSLAIRVDWDPALSTASRRSHFARYADRDILLMPPHFPPPTAGYIDSAGDRFRYRFRR